jgi:hypothetical protein
MLENISGVPTSTSSGGQVEGRCLNVQAQQHLAVGKLGR